MDGKLFIYESDDVLLPPQYHFSHNVAVRLYDDLVWLLKNDEIQKGATITITYKDEKRPEEGANILTWLASNGYGSQVDEVISRHLALALISDICHFLYMALDSAKRVKLTVALSLVRKPFLESLLIIEQLLVNEHDFLRRFEKSPEDFDPGKLKKEEKTEVINRSIKRVTGRFMLDPDLVYELRYDKENHNSFFAVSNLATHLVTTFHSSFKTESNNLNFIFSGYDEWDAQLSYFYYYVPYMLHYVNEIVDQYFREKSLLSQDDFQKRKFIRFIGQVLQFEQHDPKSPYGKSSLNKLTKGLKVTCKNCKRVNRLFKSDLFSIVHDNYVLCKHCLVDLLTESDSLRPLFQSTIK